MGFNGFYILDPFPNVLEGLTSGEKIPQFESISDEKLISDVMWMTETFLAKTLPRPINIKRNQWNSNKNFLGAYSYPSIGGEREEATPMMLAESLLNIDSMPLVLFAGEATHHKYTGYAHGAIETGWRAAKEIIDFYQQKL